MLNLNQIKKYYPEYLQPFEKHILREYIQYKILEIVYSSKQSAKLSFLGGTALRLIYNNNRFSEDLDFDNFNLSKKEFIQLTKDVKQGLEKQGFIIEIKQIFKGAFRCYIKIPEILFMNQISDLKDEKITIQIDTVPHNFKYLPNKKIINKFDVFTSILVTPLDIILSQKIYALFNRKRIKGRDIYDILFLWPQASPNYQYLKEKINIDNKENLKKELLAFCEKINLKELTQDLKPFLFKSEDSKRVRMFKNFIEQI